MSQERQLTIRRVLEGWDLVRDGGIGLLAEAIDDKLDSARPEPTGDDLERVARALHAFEDSENPYDGDYYEKKARAALAALPPSGALGLARELESEVAEPTDEELLEREREAAICGFKTASADGKDADEAARYAMTCGRRFLFHHGCAFERGSR